MDEISPGCENNPVEIRSVKDDDGKEIHVLPLSLVNQTDTPFLTYSLVLFNNWKRFKVLPHGQGTLAERQSVLEILTILDQEYNAFEEWEHEREQAAQKVARRSR